MFQKIRQFALGHKVAAGMIVFALILAGYFTYKSLSSTNQDTRYVLAAVEKGTIIVSISGSGQVSVSDQVDIKPKVSGDVVYIGVKNGQEVRAGTLLALLDTRDAQKAVRDAEIALENARLQLEKLKLNQDRDLTASENNIEDAKDAMVRAYEDGFNKVSDAFLDLPDILAGIRGILYDSTVGTSNQINTGAYQDLMDRYNTIQLAVMINQAVSNYLASAEKYNKNLDDYRTTSRYSPAEQITSLIDETLETTRIMAQTVKDEQNLLDAVVSSLKQYQQKRQIPQAITQYQSNISGYIGKLNGFISGLLNIQNTIKNSEQKLEDARQDLDMARKFNPFDVVSQENTVKQKEAALADAQEDLSNCYIRAPFGGIVAKVNVKKGDSVSGGTTVATVVTKQQIAELSLNEIDAAKIKVGQKVTFTFDAVEELTITGTVLEIDTIGTTSQGVVTYNTKIGFDTQDERVKPGMSVSADIIVDFKADILLVPNSAIKTQGGSRFVEMPDGENVGAQTSANLGGIVLSAPPRRQTVETGISNDEFSEVASGLKEGDIIVAGTINSKTTSTVNSQQRSTDSFRIPGMTGGR